MVVEGTWDLRASSSPRSLCVYVAPSASASINYGGIASEAPSSTNPFDAASSTRSTATHDSRTTAHAVVFGTERGSLHHRTYAPPRRSARSQAFSGTSSRSAVWNQPQQPLGLPSSSQSQSSRNIPRSYLPVDLQNATPGAVVAVIRASSSPTTHPVFLLLVDDSRGTSSSSKAGAFATHLVTLRHGSFTPIGSSSSLPRISCATFHPNCGFVYAAGWSVGSFFPEALEGDESSVSKQRRPPSSRPAKRIVFGHVALPSPGSRSGQDAIEVICGGHVAVVAVGNSFFAVTGSEPSFSGNAEEGPSLQPKTDTKEVVKIMSFAQSSQVHPVIVIDIQDQSLDDGWSCLFVASGRECAAVDVFYNESLGSITCGPPRHGPVTMASPILAAATSWPWVAVLTSDGLVSIRSPSCMAISLRTVEVGTRPNDYFVLRTLRDDEMAAQSTSQPWLIAISYQGEGKILQCQPDTRQDLADRLMTLAIDAFGSNGFPRSELAEAVNASFTSTSYVGPEPTAHARALLRQYLEAVLGLADFDSGGTSGWPTEMAVSNEGHYGAFDEAGRTAVSSSTGQGSTSMVSSASPAMLVSGTALLCLVCSQLSPPNSSLANNAAMACVSKVGVVFAGATISSAAVNVCETVADKLLREAKSNFSLLSVSSPTPIASSQRLSSHTPGTEFTEAAVWLLRSCGRHERAIEVLHERLHQHKVPPDVGRSVGGFWSQIKYESYTATHLSEIWASGDDQGCRLVLRSSATRRLLESNPRLGLSIFTAMHPQNASQWSSMSARDDPLAHPSYPLQVVELLKAVNPAVPYDARDTHLSSSLDEEGSSRQEEGTTPLPLESGRALAVTYLESAVGISTSRPTTEDVFDSLPPDENFEERAANLHDELSYLLLEGVIAERGDEDNDTDTKLGRLYRGKLRRFLRWPNAKVHSERLLASLPSSFLQEHALLLGRLGRHEDALRILYCDLQSLDLALEYCDALNDRRRASSEMQRNRRGGVRASEETDCAYLPLVRVALQSDPDTERGTTAAIQVLALRRSSIDRAAALRLLPHHVPVSAVARPFLIPALVDSESQVRRLTVTAALLRAKYVSLKKQLTEAQIKSQANLHAVPALRSLGLGDPLHSSKTFKARPAHSASSTFPEVMIVKHFFPRHLVIQAKITNSAAAVDGRTLGDVAFVVAESSEEAIQPTVQVPLKALPFGSTGSTWCALAAAPQRIDGTAILTCELRYTVLAVDATTGAPLSFSGGMATSGMGRTYVEELQDMEVNAAHFL